MIGVAFLNERRLGRAAQLIRRFSSRPGQTESARTRGRFQIQPVSTSGSDLGRLDLQELAGTYDRDRPRFHDLRNHGNRLMGLITLSRLWRKIFCKFVRDVFPYLGVWRGNVLDRNVRPSLGVLSVNGQPLLDPRLGIGLDRIYRALRFANPAVNALVGVDDEHVLPLVEAVHWTHFDAVHVFTLDTALVDDVGQLGVLPGDCRSRLDSFTMYAIAVLVHWLEMDAQKTYVLWLNRNSEQQALSGRGSRARQVGAEVRAVSANADPPMRTTRS